MQKKTTLENASIMMLLKDRVEGSPDGGETHNISTNTI